jgi:surface antigen
MPLEQVGHLTAEADIKAKPNHNSQTLAHAPAGARIMILPQQATAEGHVWQRVRFTDKEGFVAALIVSTDGATFPGTVMDAGILPIAAVAAHNGPGIGAPPSGRTFAPGTPLTFDAWTLGSAHLDPSIDKYDDRWFRLAGTSTWVPSAYIKGEPPDAVQHLVARHYKEALHSLLNRVNITDLTGAFPGQCVSFVKQFTHALGVDMGPTGGNGGAFEAFVNFNQPGLSLQASQASRIAFTGGEQPKEGDIVVFDQTANNQFGHIGVVQSIVGDGIFLMEQSNFNDNAPTPDNPNGVTTVDCGIIILRHNLPAGIPDRVLGGLGRVLGWLRLNTIM